MWFDDLLAALDRNGAEITFDPHLFIRQIDWNFDLDFVEETVRTGDIYSDKCEKPNKICFYKYHGKARVTYYAITRFHNNFIEVKTTWLKKGR